MVDEKTNAKILAKYKIKELAFLPEEKFNIVLSRAKQLVTKVDEKDINADSVLNLAA